VSRREELSWATAATTVMLALLAALVLMLVAG
jgi:hypothetical protein